MESGILFMLIVSFIGLINTIYLSIHKMNNTPVKCIFFPQESCDKVTTSSYSKTIGIPNPYLGFGMFVCIILSLILYTQGLTTLTPTLFFINFGFLFSLYFLYIQAYVIKAFCTWCVLSALIFVTLFILQFI